jgi:nicotinate phosphoribosyltransferase
VLRLKSTDRELLDTDSGARTVKSLFPGEQRLGLLTDLYELTMAAAYWSAGLAGNRATFDLFFRELPPHRSYMVTAGLEQVVHYLLNLRFSQSDISYLRSQPVFAYAPSGWYDALRSLRFTGDVWAIPEGTVVFPKEPLMRVTAPAMEAQLAETYLLTSLAFQTSVASKAARLVTAARGRSVVDFGSRRAHGPQAGLLAARASFIGGCSGTSNTAAAEQLGIQPVGTMAHSWIMAFEDEREAFRHFAAVFPERATFLIDTYDTIEGARNAVRCGAKAAAVRLDSGDFIALSKQVRRILDEAGWRDVTIFASGDLNEYKIENLLAAHSPIDSFGVGTELVTVADAPSLGVVYKLVDFEGTRDHSGRIKLSAHKQTYPGLKQVFRDSEYDGKFRRDMIGLASESLAGEPLLQLVVTHGKLVSPMPPLQQIQQHCRNQLERLPAPLLALERRTTYPVEISFALQAEYDRLARLQALSAVSAK